MQRLLWVCLAGAVGTGTRYLVALWVGQRFDTNFPVATLIVNLVGCFLIAVVLQASLLVTGFSPDLRVVLTTGFMGGLTTYSAFNFETTTLWLTGARRAALLNFGLTTVGCVCAGMLGLLLARRLFG
jgi:CrcB protein